MVVLQMEMQVQGRHRERFLDTVLSQLAPIRTEDGCLSCRLLEDVQRSSTFVLVEEWQDRDMMAGHFGGPRFRALLIAMDMLTRPPILTVKQVSYHWASETIGDLHEVSGS